ncbi:MAG: hypothetical protein ACK45J_00380 [Acidimicrobiaceae bacterium]|jgi:tight adherence protein C|nr:hypothetical protein [Ilumatobacteraceae bacterium]
MTQWIADEADTELLEICAVTHRQSVVRVTSVSTGIAAVISVSALTTFSRSTAMCVVVLSVVGAVLYSTQPARRIFRDAESVRRQLDLATAVFLDLVNVMVAGGAGIETSVLAASHSGDGPGFSLIRTAVMRAQSARVSYWDSLAELGHRVQVSSLVEVAHTVQLAGQHGARVRTSLVTKAESLRKKNLARVEFDEEQRTEKIGLPLVVLFMGFLTLVGYPAFVQTMSSF